MTVNFMKPIFRLRYPVLRWWLELKSKLRTPLARLWRPLMFRTKFIAVCGSAGKTTTKEILGSILAQNYTVAKTNGTWGGFRFGGVAGTILSVRPWHKFAVVEAAIETQGEMAKMAQLIKPDIVIMLAVKECHLMMFKSLDAIAAEKSEMVKALTANGTAILNEDDARVIAMSEIGSFETIKFGQNCRQISVEQADSSWPNRLELTLNEGGEEFPVKTRLVGKHWINAILAAVTAARHCGMPMEEIVPTVEKYKPFWARMQPITLDNGVTFLRDEFNGSYDTFVEAIQVMSDATAARKVAIVSDFSDSHLKNEKRRKRLNRLAREMVPHIDVMIFVGEDVEYGRQAAINAGLAEESAFYAYDVIDASDILKKVQQPGDLVLLKGRTNHHLSRVYLGQLGTVTCSLQPCSRQYLCDRCANLGFPWEEKYKDIMAPAEIIV